MENKSNPLPDILIDDDGYPTAEFLEWIERYDVIENGVYYLLDVLSRNWIYGDWGFIRKKPRNKKFTVELHTGGWSGNEDLIRALKANNFFWFYWIKSVVGGHYWFSFPVEKIN